MGQVRQFVDCLNHITCVPLYKSPVLRFKAMPVVLTGKQGMVVASGSMDVKKGLEGVSY